MIKSNKLRWDSCGYKMQLSDITTTRTFSYMKSYKYMWSKLFRENLDESEIDKLLEEVEFINNKQKEEISALMTVTYSRIRRVFNILNLERVEGYTKVIENICGKEILISVDGIYRCHDKLYGVIAKDKYKDRYKKKSPNNMGWSKTTYEGILTCQYINPALDGIIYADLHPFFKMTTEDTDEFIQAHLSFYDPNKSDTLKPLDELINNCEKAENCFLCKYKIFCEKQPVKESIPCTAPKIPSSSNPITLTQSQDDFVNTLSGVIKVNAVAGSGKTSAVALRIVNLLKNGYSPQDILCISFTNNAVSEMKEKIAKYTNDEIAEKCNVYTFHGFCQKVLEKHYMDFGYSAPPSIASKVEKVKILNDVLDRLPKIPGLYYENPALNMKKAKGSLFQAYDLVDEYLKKGYISKRDMELDVFSIVSEMEKEMLENNLIDLNSLISHINYLDLNDFQFSHIILDEAQDTSEVQFDILKKIASKPRTISLAVVGDELQNIFQWLYLSKDNLANLSSKFNSVKVINFSENFRTTEEIASYANKLIENMSPTSSKIIANKQGVMPQFMKINDYSEINDIIRMHNSFEYGTIGILARNKSLSSLLSIQYNSGAKYLFKQDIVHSVTKLAKYLLDGSNPEVIFEYLKYTNQDFDDSDLEGLSNLYKTKKDEIDSLKKVFLSYSSHKDLFLYLIAHMRDDDNVLSNINFSKFKTLNNIYDYLIHSELFDDDTTYTTQNDSNVIFSTVHSSKGSEYETVILLLDKFKIETEEDKRLLYVAVTRAKENLYFVYKEPNEKIIRLLS